MFKRLLSSIGLRPGVKPSRSDVSGLPMLDDDAVKRWEKMHLGADAILELGNAPDMYARPGLAGVIWRGPPLTGMAGGHLMRDAWYTYLELPDVCARAWLKNDQRANDELFKRITQMSAHERVEI